jgi:hypothetical protein
MFRILGKSKIAFALAILFGISMLFFKSGSTYSNFFNSDSVIAKVSGTPISTNKFNNAMQNNVGNFNQMIGRSMTGEEIRSNQIHTLALGSLINNAVFENEYDKINFIIDEKVIAQRTKSRIPKLYDKNNKINELYLNSLLEQQKLKIEDLVQIINYETRDQFMNDSFFDINYPKYFTNKISNFENHKRVFSFTEMPLDRININDILDEQSNNIREKLKNFYELNINNYMSKETRDIEYFVINKNESKQDFLISNFEAEEYYNNNKKIYFQEEARSFIQFNFKKIKEAKDFKEQTLNYSLDEVIKYSNENKIRFNEFNDLKFNDILKEIANPLFKLLPNKQSDLIETSIAKHIIILKSIKPSNQLQFKDVEEDIKKTIQAIEKNNYYKDISDQISEQINNGVNISNIAKQFNMDLLKIKNLTKDFENSQLLEKEILNKLLPAAFGSNKDFVNNIIEINQELSFVFNVSNINIPTPFEFKNIEEKILNDWKTSKKIEKLKITINNNIKNDNFLNDFRNEYGLEIKTLLLDKKSNLLPANLLNKIFQSKKNNNIKHVNQETLYIGRIQDIIISENVVDEKTLSLANDLRSSFGQTLMKGKKITTNENLINAIIERY